MFVIDVSPSMGKTKYVDLSDGTENTLETTNLEWSLHFVRLKIQEMVCSSTKLNRTLLNTTHRFTMVERRTSAESFSLAQTVSSSRTHVVTHTDHLKDTDNIVNTESGGYEHVTEFIPIGQPNAGTLAKLATLEPSTEIGDRKLILLIFHPQSMLNAE